MADAGTAMGSLVSSPVKKPTVDFFFPFKQSKKGQKRKSQFLVEMNWMTDFGIKDLNTVLNIWTIFEISKNW